MLIVLWTLVLLSLLISVITASGSLRTRQAGDYRRNAQLEALADGGVEEGMFHLLDPSAPPRGGHWFADGATHRIRRGDVILSIALVSEAGKINPNRATIPLLASLLQAVGADARTAAALAPSIVAWRFPGTPGTEYRAAGRDYLPPGAPFESLSELGLVLGMTPQLVAALEPHLSLYHDGDPDPAVADPVVRRALLAAGNVDPDTAPADAASAGRNESVVTVTAEAQDATGHRFLRRAIILTGQGGPASSDDHPFRVMSWDAPGA